MPPKVKRESPICVFDLTITKVDGLDHLTVKSIMKNLAKKWCFQLESGTEGYLHYQCRLSLKVADRLSTMIKKFHGLHPLIKGHVSATSEENRKNFFYVMKEESRVAGPWKDDDQEIPNWLDYDLQRFPWQIQIENIIKTPCSRNYEDRCINVIIDRKGKEGKSTYIMWGWTHGLFMSLPYMNNSKEIMQAVYDLPASNCYFIDIPRAVEKNKMNEFMQGMENLKDGRCFDPRYGFRQKAIQKPHIWLCMNCEPHNMNSMLSTDRWKLWEITSERELIEYKRENNVSLQMQMQNNEIDIKNCVELYRSLKLGVDFKLCNDAALEHYST
jgi:hypothetical protein